MYSRKWHHRLPLLLQESDPAGNATAWEYDDRGRLWAVIDPAGGRTAFINDEYGQTVSATDPNGGVYGFAWNRMGLLTRYEDCSGKVSVYSHDVDGNLMEFRDPLGQTTSLRHDAVGRLLAVRLPDASNRAYAWDKAGRLVESVDGEGQVSRMRYNPHGELAQYVNPMNQVTGYAYDRAGSLTSLTNENDEYYAFAYDAANRLVSQTGLDGTVTRYELDSLGFPIAVIEGAGTEAEQVTRLERDLAGRLSGKITAGTRTGYAYDALGRVTDIIRTGPGGEAFDSIHFSYDPLGNLIEERTEAGGEIRVLAHAYDPLGNRVSSTLPDGRVINYAYCGSGFLHQISTASGEGGLERIISAFERDDLHRETLRTQGRRHSLSSYDPLSRLRGRRSLVRRDLPESVLPRNRQGVRLRQERRTGPPQRQFLRDAGIPLRPGGPRPVGIARDSGPGGAPGGP